MPVMPSRMVVKSKTLVEVLRERAAIQPDRTAFTFLVDGEKEEVSQTYQSLDRAARAVAAQLQALIPTGERAILLYPPGLDYIAAFFGCLYAGVVAVPAYPPDLMRLERTLPRFLGTIRSAGPAAILTTTTILPMVLMLAQQHPELLSMHILSTDNLDPQQAGAWREPEIHPGTLAFLQYTSGSTAEPKGVMLSHGNLIHNLNHIYHSFAINDDMLGLIWLPPYHDMGLIGGILEPVYAGFPVVLMSPLDFLQRPLRWLRVMSRIGATASGGPNFAYELCVRKITPEQRETLDLSRWGLAFCGAEPVHAETLRRFADAFKPSGFRYSAFFPCYGLAEVTLFATGAQKGEGPVLQDFRKVPLAEGRAEAAPASGASDHQAEEDSLALVSSGYLHREQRIVIVDAETHQVCPPNRVGEIWISSPSVAQGYWNDPQASAHTFRAHIVGQEADGPFLRTGDLGFIQAGQLFVTGRLKDVIIIDGLNHYPQDIEAAVETSHPLLRPGCSAAFSVQHIAEERLVIAAEVARGVQPGENGQLNSEIVRAIRTAVSRNHDLRVYDVVLLRPGTIPKTSSGKIQRHACQAGYLAGSLDVWASPAP